MQSLTNEIKEKVNKLSIPAQPSTFGSEYSFPEDAQHLNSIELGNWMFKLSAWKSYALRILTYKEVDHKVMQDQYDKFIMMSMSSIPSEAKIKNKESAIGKILCDYPAAQEMYDSLTKRSTEIIALKRIVEIYTIQLEVLSREISRRSIDSKVMRGMPDV